MHIETINLKFKKMMKTTAYFAFLFLLLSCNKVAESLGTGNSTASEDVAIQDAPTIDYKSLEGTPFTFTENDNTRGSDATVCSRRLFGSDILKVLSEHAFSASSGAAFPFTEQVNEDGYVKVQPQKGYTYYGNMKVSANGEFVYFDAYTRYSTSGRYSKSPYKVKLTPIQIPEYPLQMDLEIEQSGRVVIKEKLTMVPQRH